MKDYLTKGVTFLQEAWTELSKVHFNSPKETMQATAVVVILAVVMALWLGLIDLFAVRGVRQILG
jgi:preprotein translocase SecE subunit